MDTSTKEPLAALIVLNTWVETGSGFFEASKIAEIWVNLLKVFCVI